MAPLTLSRQMMRTAIPERKATNQVVTVVMLHSDGSILTTSGTFDSQGYGIDCMGKLRPIRKSDNVPTVEEHTCGDCDCKEGEYHTPGCDMEICPFCGGQLRTCDCVYDVLGIRNRELYTAETAYLPPEIYTGGLTPEQEEAWAAKLEEKGLVPFIYYPQLCGRCGQHWPVFFRVSDEEWQKYIDPKHRKLILCRSCFDEIKRLVDSHAPATHS
jgi:hypothetical protein